MKEGERLKIKIAQDGLDFIAGYLGGCMLLAILMIPHYILIH